MVQTILILIQILFSALFFSRALFVDASTDLNVLGAEDSREEQQEVSFPTIDHTLTMETETAFDQKEVVETEFVEFETQYVDDPDLEYGKEEVQVDGVAGVRELTYLVTHWLDYEIDRVLLTTEETPPTTEVISVGKKIIWRDLSTPDLGEIDYWAKMTVFATKYDSTCLGCNNTTALGAPVHEGVCAVDPKVIPMYTHFYVPGYGKCQALDVGGLIKGKRIDLAFRDAHSAAWGAEYVEIYLMDNEPEDGE